MRLTHAATLLSALTVLALGACSKPEAEIAAKAHGAENADTEHGSEPAEEVVTMEQAVADARAAAESPMAATPTPVTPATVAPDADAQAASTPDAHAAPAGSPPAAPAEHTAGH